MKALTKVALAVVTSVLVPSRLAPQDSAACAFDTAAHTRTHSVILGLVPVWRDGEPKEIRADYLKSAQAIRDHFRRPDMLRLPSATRIAAPRGTVTTRHYAPFGLHGFVRFELDPIGRLANGDITVASASPDVITSMVAAVRRADSARAFSQPSKSVRRKNGEILLRFVDTVRIEDPSVALHLTIPAIDVDSAPAVLSMKRLRYPTHLRTSRITGRVLLEFIVRTDSVMEPSSLQLLEAPYEEFAAEAIDGVRSARFRPATVGRCAIPALVRLPVDFKIRGAPFTP